jgi:S-DNA-T family DNA segregation ATPase FtsK/SpoIIIE
MLPTAIDKNASVLGGGSDSRDELFADAARVVVRHQQGSTSLLQRYLKVGYARAARIMDELEAAGIVGAPNGSKGREVMLDSEMELEAYL